MDVLLIGDEGPHDALQVHALVLVELLVLGREDGILHDRRSASFDVVAVLVVERRQQRLFVRRVDVRDLRRRRLVSSSVGSSPNPSALAFIARPPMAIAGKAAAATTTPASTPQISSDAALAKML